MSFEGTGLQVLKRHEQTEQLLDIVRRAADENKGALGFLPASVYHDFSRKECLYVLIDGREEEPQYAGHLLFTLRYPVATVIQMHIEPRYRRQGHAAKLVEYFCEELTRIGFTSVYAGVAEDLAEANRFWDAQKFHVQAVRRGGKAESERSSEDVASLILRNYFHLVVLVKIIRLGLPPTQLLPYRFFFST